MSSRNAFLLIAVAVAAGAAGWLAGRGTGTNAAPAGVQGVEIYQCPMHPYIKSDRPGKCTVCGMSLVATRVSPSPGGSGNPAMPAGTVVLGASQITAIGVETTAVSKQPLVRTVRVSGRIEDDDTRHRILAAHVPGRIESLNITFAGEVVLAGERLATIYSPDILAAERIYVERLKAGVPAYSSAEIATAKESLQELGLSPEDMLALEESRLPSALVIVRAPFEGTVVSKSVYEGQYVKGSDTLFEIGDFRKMWFMFDAYEQDLPWLKFGQLVDVTTAALPGEVLTAPIAFIDPNFDPVTRTAKVRVVIDNPHIMTGGDHRVLPHRVLASGLVHAGSPEVLTAPRTAVLDAGSGPVAYVDAGGQSYEQRKLKLGRRGDTLVEVLDGLREGEKVVTHGALLIDAQAQLQTGNLP